MHWISVFILSVTAISGPWAEIRQYQAPGAKNSLPQEGTTGPQPQVVPRGGVRLNSPVLPIAGVPAALPSSPTVAEKDLKFKQEVEGSWNKIMNEFSGKPAAPSLIVFISANDYSKEAVSKIRELRKLPELQKLAIPLEFYIEEVSDQKGMELFKDDLETGEGLLSEGLEIPVDDKNEKSKAYAVPSGQTTIVYRDATGAVRLYNLRLELDTLQRQLARELKAAQPAR